MGKIILIPDSLFSDLPFTEVFGQDPDIDLIRLLRNDRVIQTLCDLRPDVLVLGIAMREFNPFDCCKIIKSNPTFQKLKVLFVSDEPGSPLEERARSLHPDLIIDSNHAVERIQTYLQWEWTPQGKIERRVSRRYVMDKPIRLDRKNEEKPAAIVDASSSGVYFLAVEPLTPDEIVAIHATSKMGDPFTFPLRVVRRVKLLRPVERFMFGIGAQFLRPPELMAEQIKRVLENAAAKPLESP